MWLGVDYNVSHVEFENLVRHVQERRQLGRATQHLAWWGREVDYSGSHVEFGHSARHTQERR